MSENNHSVTNTESRENNSPKGTNRHHRNRHRPHGKGGNRPRPEVEQEAAVVANPSPSQKEENNGEKKNRNDKNQRNAAKKKGQDRHHQNKGRRDARFSSESRTYDPYEMPSKEEIALSELRAKIVMKAADGSVPTVYGAPPQKAEAEAPVVQAAQPADEIDAAALLDRLDSAETEEVKKVEVVGIRFRSAGKMYYFDPHGIKVKKGSCAIVETTRGPEFGDVCLGNTMINASETVAPLRPLIRVATPADVAKNAENREKEKDALKICQEKVREHKLEMKLIDVQYAFDGSKLLFYFSADGRVDFRELVKDLASVFRTRIELRQIGIRDEAKLLGGIGACGRSLCCATFLPDFAQVSIKMAKDQSLSLNSAKISGVCGRLMCCLRYEQEVYQEEIRKTPAVDSTVRTPDGVGTVISNSPLAGTVRVVFKDQPDTPPKQYHRDELTLLQKEKKNAQNNENHAEKATEKD